MMASHEDILTCYDIMLCLKEQVVSGDDGDDDGDDVDYADKKTRTPHLGCGE